MNSLFALTIVSALLIIIFYRNLRTLFVPPVGVLLSIFLTGFFSLIMLYSDSLGYDVNIDYLTQTVLLYSIALLGFLLPWVRYVFFRNKPPQMNLIILSKIQENSMNILLIGCIVVCISLLYLQGGILLLGIQQNLLSIQDSKEQARNLPPGLLLLNSVIPMIFFLYFAQKILLFAKLNNINKLKFISTAFFLIFLSLYQGTRQSLLMLIFSIFATFSVNKIRMNYFVITGFLVVFLFFFMSVRQIRSSDNIFLREMMLYQVISFWNMNSIAEKYQPSGVPYMIFSEILPSRAVDVEKSEIKEFLIEPSAPAGFISYIYMDFGAIGVFCGSLIFGVTSRIFYAKRKINLFWQSAFIVILYSNFTFVTYSHFVTLVFFGAPIILLLIMSILERILMSFSTENKTDLRRKAQTLV